MPWRCFEHPNPGAVVAYLSPAYSVAGSHCSRFLSISPAHRAMAGTFILSGLLVDESIDVLVATAPDGKVPCWSEEA
jgi:hypothetical protein